MLGLKLNHVSKRGHRRQAFLTGFNQSCPTCPSLSHLRTRAETECDWACPNRNVTCHDATCPDVNVFILGNAFDNVICSLATSLKIESCHDEKCHWWNRSLSLSFRCSTCTNHNSTAVVTWAKIVATCDSTDHDKVGIMTTLSFQSPILSRTYTYLFSPLVQAQPIGLQVGTVDISRTGQP